MQYSTANIPMELIPPAAELMQRYSELRAYVTLTDDDICRIVAVWDKVRPVVPSLIDDFYATIMQHQNAAAVIRDPDQVQRLKLSLQRWLEELFTGNYDERFVRNRWLVGWRHVKIGLPQVWAAAAMSRLCDRLVNHLAEDWQQGVVEFQRTISALKRVIDLDLALIQDAYHTESVAKYLQSEKDFNDAIIGTTQSIVVEVDDAGLIRRGNTFLSRLVCGADQLDSRIAGIDDLIPVEDRAAMRELLSRTCMPEPCGPVVTKLMDANSRSRTIRWFARTIMPHSTRIDVLPRGVQLLVGHDVTDLSDAQRLMVQQERLAAIGQTMAGLAHESRNAFQRSQAALETLALELEDRPDAVQLLGRIQRANDHLLHLYEEVLQFAKPVRLDLKQCELAEIAEATCHHVLQATRGDHDSIKVQVQGVVPKIMADPYAVEQILRNLIENALVVSPPDTPVLVCIASAWQGDQPSLRIEVKDQGPGILPEHMERIFEPFFSTRARGTGLGLPIARRLAEAHGGSLELHSTGIGTTAVLLLPEVSSGDQATDPEDAPDHRRQAH
jgi:signal transduction histidine kinase